MNVRHIGDIALPPLCFCINCPLERVTLPASGLGKGVVAHSPDPNPPPPPPNTDCQLRSLWMGDENCVGGM